MSSPTSGRLILALRCQKHPETQGNRSAAAHPAGTLSHPSASDRENQVLSNHFSAAHAHTDRRIFRAARISTYASRRTTYCKMLQMCRLRFSPASVHIDLRAFPCRAGENAIVDKFGHRAYSGAVTRVSPRPCAHTPGALHAFAPRIERILQPPDTAIVARFMPRRREHCQCRLREADAHGRDGMRSAMRPARHRTHAQELRVAVPGHTFVTVSVTIARTSTYAIGARPPRQRPYPCSSAACAATRRAIGTRKGEQLT